MIRFLLPIVLSVVCFRADAQIDLNAGLMAYYPFNGNANDESGNGNNAVFNNASLTRDYYGNPNSAYYFNGVDNYMRIANSQSLNPSNKISLCVWVKPEGFYKGTCHGNRIIMKGDQDYLTGNYTIAYDDVAFHGSQMCSVPTVDTVHQTFRATGVSQLLPGMDTPYVQKNVWRSIVMTYGGAVARLYVDCNLIMEESAPGLTFSNSHDLFLGKMNHPNYPYWFNGVMDEVRIYNRALNVDEVKAYSFACKNQLPCENWLKITQQDDLVQTGDVVVAGDQLTVEALFNCVDPLASGLDGATIVAKKNNNSDCNYWLRTNSAAITTTIGYFNLAPVCEVESNRTYHIAMVYNGATLRFYRNGFLLQEMAAAGNLILNDIKTTIGFLNENQSGYINEVRIWKKARSQEELLRDMNASVYNPASYSDLLAYYRFEDLSNKQGNADFAATLQMGALINQNNPDCDNFIIDSCGMVPTSDVVNANFSVPDTVCVNQEVSIINNSSNATTHYWSFCNADINTTPTGVDLGNLNGDFSIPVFMDFAEEGGNYYGFVVNNSPGGLVRLNFGNSLLNTPTTTFLGSIGGAIKGNTQGIQLVNTDGKWYALIVGGDQNGPIQSQLVVVSFGASLANNSPTAVDRMNIGTMNYPHDLFVFQDGNEWFGLTVNYNSNTITRFSFGTDLSAPPTAVNLGSVGGLNRPSGITAINKNGSWYVFVMNYGDNTLSRLDFGNSLLNTPTGVNLGNPGNFLSRPRDLNLIDFCGNLTGFLINGDASNSLVRLNFETITSIPVVTVIPATGGMNTSHSISKIFRDGENLYGFVPNSYANTLTRLMFQGGCGSDAIPPSTEENPDPIKYATPGTYTIYLTVDEGLPTQSSYCQQITVLPQPSISPKSFTVCPGESLILDPQITDASAYKWSPGSDLSSDNIAHPTASPSQSTQYTLIAGNGICESTETINVTVLAPEECVAAVPSFTAPTEVCANNPITIVNNSSNAQSFRWSFCPVDNSGATLSAENLGTSFPMGSEGSAMDYVKVGSNYYGFLVHFFNPDIIRLDFGTSLLNTPTATVISNPGGIVPDGNGYSGIQVVSANGSWYLVTVSGHPVTGHAARVVIVDLGADIQNTSPTAKEWTTVGNLDLPMELHLFQENGTWHGFTVNHYIGTLTRFSFGSDFDSPPTATNLGDFGLLSNTGGFDIINDNGVWRMFVVNYRTNPNQSYIVRLDFGNSLLNQPTAVYLGNPGDALQFPNDISVMQTCGASIAYVVNANGTFAKLDFVAGLAAAPTGLAVPYVDLQHNPHSFSLAFRAGNNTYAFLPGNSNNWLHRISHEGCSNPALPGSTDENPDPVVFDKPGTYRIRLVVNEGLANEATICQEIKVTAPPVAEFEFSRDICFPTVFTFTNSSKDYQNLLWDFGNGQTATDMESASIDFGSNGTYQIRLRASRGANCYAEYTNLISIDILRDSAIINRDTSICATNQGFQLNALPALSYCWFPAAGLSATNIANPEIVVPNIPGTTTYYLHAEVFSETNLVINGDFSNGNTGFQSDYANDQNSGYAEGIYAVRSDVAPWHPGMADCRDYTTGNGHMLLVNGSAIVNAKVWTQQITVKPNTDYAFAAWIMSLHNTNPAQLKFSINDVPLGTPINASAATCTWQQFYTVWNSGNNTSAEISIVNLNQSLGGNDFALDDISFSELRTVRDSITITIHSNPEIDFTHSVVACKAIQLEGYVLNAGTPVNHWNWHFGDGNNDEAQIISYRYKDGGAYNVKLVASDVNGCLDSIIHTIQLDTVKAIIFNSDTSVCKNATMTLKGEGGTSAVWSPTYSVVDPNEFTTDAEIEQTRKYYLTVRDDIGCEHTDSILVSVIPPPVFNKPPNIQACADSLIRLKGANDPQFQYAWTPAASLDDPTAMDPVGAAGGPSVYQVIVTEPLCGYNRAFNVAVTVNPNPTIMVSKASDIDCRMPSTYIQADMSGGTHIAWSPATGLDNPNIPRPLVSASKTTTYTAKVTNEYGCTATDSITVNVSDTDLKLFDAPNAFTPNGDGYNDCFSLKRWGATEILEFHIYNRWGKRVFTGRSVSDCWDGTFRGQAQPQGTYVYFVKARTICGDVFRKGHVNLIR